MLCALLLGWAAASPWSAEELAQAFLAAGRPRFFDADLLLPDAQAVAEAAEKGVLAESFSLLLVRETRGGNGTAEEFAQQVALQVFPNVTYFAGALLAVAAVVGPEMGVFAGYNVRYLYPNVTLARMLASPRALLARGETQAGALALVENLEHPERFEVLTWRGIFYLVLGSLLAALLLADLALLCVRRAAEKRVRGVFEQYWRRRAEGWGLADFFQRACFVCLQDIGPQAQPGAPPGAVVGAELCALSCGHLFHANCISKPFEATLQCPLCGDARYIADFGAFEAALVRHHARRERRWLAASSVRFLFRQPAARVATGRYVCSAEDGPGV